MSSRLLLDTCAALWIMDNSELSKAAIDAMDDASDRGEPVHVSPITGWEVGLLASRGRFKSHHSPQRWLQGLLATPMIRLAELPPNVLLESSFLPGDPPRDPSDRILAATAREFDFTLVTRDRWLLRYAADGYLSAIAC